MEMDGLRSELERLFELDELVRLSSDLLGLNPKEIGGLSGKASFVRALTDHCDAHGAVEALCDAVIASKPHANGEIAATRHIGLADHYDVPKGADFAGFTIHHKLADGPQGSCYLATRGSEAYRVKILQREATRDPIGVHRFLTFCRILANMAQPALPQRLQVGSADRRVYLAHELFDGEALSVRLGRTGALPLSEAQPILLKTAQALAALHAARQCHGNLKPENVISAHGGGTLDLQLQDAGTDLLRSRKAPNGRLPVLSLASPKTVAPEQLRGGARSPVSDVYSFGATFYELLCGRPPFVADSVLDMAIQHLSEPPKPPSAYAPRGWIPELLDRFLVRLLSKDPRERPENGAALAAELERLWNAPIHLTGASHEDIATHIDALLEDPADDMTAQALEALAVGPARQRIYEAFASAAERAAASDQRDVQKALLLRAAAGFRSIGDLAKSAAAYEALIALGDVSAPQWDALDEVRAQLGKHEEIIDSMLARIEGIDSPGERAALMARIGEIYSRELDDTAQAAIAFTQAMCEDPATPSYARRIEAVVEGRDDIWNDVLAACAEASNDERDPKQRIPILEQMGMWYLQKLSRPELALPCFQQALKLDPKRAQALEGVALVYRANKMWSELGDLLIHRADVSSSPSDARELRTQAAQLFEQRLSDTSRARELYERVLSDDPEHSLAHQSLTRIYEEAGEIESLIPILQSQVESGRGNTRPSALLRLGDLYRTRLGDLNEARRCYELLLGEQPNHFEALHGLDQVLAQSGQYRELLDSLQRQLASGDVTPRRQVTLLERIAAIYEDEFLLHTEAASALEKVLTLDPTRTQSMQNLARLYRTLERWTALADLYRRHAERTDDTDQKVTLLMARGRVLAEQVGDLAGAVGAYQQVVALAPDRREARDAIADLQEALGNAGEAIEAVQELASRADTPEAKARYYLRVARLMESRGSQEDAIDWYTRALEVEPGNTRASTALRTAFAARGDAGSIVELIRHDIGNAEGDRPKARLAAEMAALQYTKLKDLAGAEQSAREALEWDAHNLQALVLMGDLSYDAGRFAEATTYYQQVIPRTDALVSEDAVRVLTRYLDAEGRAPSIPPDLLLAHSESLLQLAPDSLDVVGRTAALAFEQADYARARALYQDFLERFRGDLDRERLAEATYRLGESLRLLDEPELALTCLEEASDLTPSAPLPLIALAKVYEAKEQWSEVLRTKVRLLELNESALPRARLLIEIGELLLDKLKEHERAVVHLREASQVAPDDRKVLTRLMQIYMSHQVWDELVEIVERLARFVEDGRQKAKYLMTAAMVSARHLGRRERAIDFYQQVLALDPDNAKALSECVVLQIEQGDFLGAEESLVRQLEKARESGERRAELDVLDALSRLYMRMPDRLDETVLVLEQAAELEPGKPEYRAALAELYERDLGKYAEQAIAAQMVILRQEPDRADAYRKLRQIYTETRRADAAWCLCQVLSLLHLAEPDEMRFFERVRSPQPAAAQSVIDESDWSTLLIHPDVDARLSLIFSLIEPVIVATRSQPSEALGYDPRLAVDLSQHPYPLGHMLYYAAGVMGLRPPPTFENHREPGGLLFLNSQPPAIVLGISALQMQIPAQTAAFVAARQLCYFRPGFYVRRLVASTTALKAWLFGAFKLCTPGFPIAHELEGPVFEARAALETHLVPEQKDRLVDVITKLLHNSPAIDLKQWVTGVDLTADRIGLVLANDLRTVTDIIKSVDDPASPSRERRLQELILYAVSEPFFAIRRRLGVAIESLT
jgi:tetratricopeptide (TPR) repeat protein